MDLGQNEHSYSEKTYANSVLINGDPGIDQTIFRHEPHWIVLFSSLGSYILETENFLLVVDLLTWVLKPPSVLTKRLELVVHM